jgi:tyrosyl-tRNA synthetase
LKLIKSLHSEGRIKERTNKSFAFSFPLLTDKQGKKISKSDDNKKAF